MTSKNIFFTFGFWVELPQILGLGFSVWHLRAPRRPFTFHSQAVTYAGSQAERRAVGDIK